MTFVGWGIALAITTFWAAPWVMRRISRKSIILTVLPLVAVDLIVAGLVAETAAAALLWHAAGVAVPYLFAAASVLIAALTVFLGRRILAHTDDPATDPAEDAVAIVVGDAA